MHDFDIIAGGIEVYASTAVRESITREHLRKVADFAQLVAGGANDIFETMDAIEAARAELADEGARIPYHERKNATFHSDPEKDSKQAIDAKHRDIDALSRDLSRAIKYMLGNAQYVTDGCRVVAAVNYAEFDPDFHRKD